MHHRLIVLASLSLAILPGWVSASQLTMEESVILPDYGQLTPDRLISHILSQLWLQGYEDVGAVVEHPMAHYVFIPEATEDFPYFNPQIPVEVPRGRISLRILQEQLIPQGYLLQITSQGTLLYLTRAELHNNPFWPINDVISIGPSEIVDITKCIVLLSQHDLNTEEEPFFFSSITSMTLISVRDMDLSGTHNVREILGYMSLAIAKAEKRPVFLRVAMDPASTSGTPLLLRERAKWKLYAYSARKFPSRESQEKIDAFEERYRNILKKN